jgi:hypothetical protein
VWYLLRREKVIAYPKISAGSADWTLRNDIAPEITHIIIVKIITGIALSQIYQGSKVAFLVRLYKPKEIPSPGRNPSIDNTKAS